MKKLAKGRHAAPTAKTMGAGAATATATAVGIFVGSSLPAAVGAEERVEIAGPANVAESPAEVEDATFTVSGGADFSIPSVSVESDAPEAPVAEPEEAPAEEVAPAEEAPAAPAAEVQAAPAPEPEPVAVPAASGLGNQIVAIARSYAGAPYVWGGTTPAGWDCIGYARFVYGQVGISLPASSSGARYAGVQIPASQAQPGDLMWWPGHVGIYTGGGMHIAAWNPSMGTQEAPVWGSPIYLRVY